MNRLQKPFARALDLATVSIADVAEAIEKGYSTVTAYVAGTRRVTPEAAHALARYLRERAGAFTKAAHKLDAAADREERRQQ